MGNNTNRPVVLVKKKFKDCERVVVDGIGYRDVTELLFEESKYIKTYPNYEELKEIEKAQERKRKYVMRKARKQRINQYDTQTEKGRMDVIEMLLDEGLFGEEIIKETGINRYFYNLAIEQLKKESRFKRSHVKNKHYDPWEDEKIIQMEKDGYTRVEIAKELKRSVGGIQARVVWLRKRNRL